jgi:hypothetical protein
VLLLLVVLSECWLSLLPVLVLPPPLLWLPLLSELLPLLLWLLLLPSPLVWLWLLPFSLLLQVLGLELPLLDSELWFLGLLLPLPDDPSSSPEDIEALLLSLFAFCFASDIVSCFD